MKTEDVIKVSVCVAFMLIILGLYRSTYTYEGAWLEMLDGKDEAYQALLLDTDGNYSPMPEYKDRQGEAIFVYSVQDSVSGITWGSLHSMAAVDTTMIMLIIDGVDTVYAKYDPSDRNWHNYNPRLK